LSGLFRTGERQVGYPVDRKTGDEVYKNEADKEQTEGYTGNSRQMGSLEFQVGQVTNQLCKFINLPSESTYF
jgi:hypothetical protein